MSRPHPCPAPSPGWYAGPYEDRFEVGPCETKEVAVEEAFEVGACATIDGAEPGTFADVVHYCRARQAHVDLSKQFDADHWLEELWDRMDDEWGPDDNGNNHPLDAITSDLKASLEESVRLAIWHWQERNKLPLRTYWFAETWEHGEEGRAP